MDNFKVLFWNSNGIIHKLNELHSLALQLKTKFTLLTKHDHPRLPNFIFTTILYVYRNDLLTIARCSPVHGCRVALKIELMTSC